MIRHIIFIASSYWLGKQIAWHYAAEEISQNYLQELRALTKERLGKPNFAIHKLSTESKDWASVVEKGSFFASFELYDSFEDFLEEIALDKKITVLDISKYLLAVQPMSNLKLQKMIYLVYADYLVKTKKALFDEQIIAMQYGPLIPEVYDAYKVHGRDEIETNSKKVILDEITLPMALAKILQADDSKAILESIKQTIENYGSKTASQLVDITYWKGRPWSEAPFQGQEITDDLILSQHYIEVV